MELPESLAGQGMIGVDCETCDPDLKSKGSGAHRGSFIAGVAIATEAGFRAYLPMRHESGDNLPVRQTMHWIKRQMKLPAPKVGARLLYDHEFLTCEGARPEGPLYDVQNAEPLLDENRFTYSLEVLARDYLGTGKHDEELDTYLISHFGKKDPKNHIWRAPPEIVAPYAIADAEMPLQIFAKQKPKLEEQQLWDLFVMESKLVPLLSEMRRRGVCVDVARAEEMLAECKQKRGELLEEVHRQTGIALPPSGMGKEVLKVMQSIGITDFPLTPKLRKPALTADFIDSVDHPVAEMIVQIRKMDKLIGTFLESSILNAHYRGRIHCNFNQLRSENGGAVSGRFSSSKPNLQFIPVRSDLGKKIRSLFLPDEGRAWYKLDFSQIEYVLMVHDAVMTNLPEANCIAQMYRDDVKADFHQLVADMTGLDRMRAKTINFGLAYGEGVDKLCRQLGLSREDGEALIQQYHKRAPFMRPLINGCMGQAANRGEILTLMGRRRRFHMWEAWDHKRKEKIYLNHYIPGAKRAFTHKALNARTQGSAADVMKAAMVDAWEDSGIIRVLGAPQLTVHDELDGSVPRTREGYQALVHLKRTMEQCVKLSIPLRVDAEVGLDWGRAQKVKLDGSDEDLERFYDQRSPD